MFLGKASKKYLGAQGVGEGLSINVSSTERNKYPGIWSDMELSLEARDASKNPANGLRNKINDYQFKLLVIMMILNRVFRGSLVLGVRAC